jgi:hypothetical protein
MRATLASLSLLLLFGILSDAMPADKITYLECRADNEDTSSLFALDDTTQKVCDRAVQPTWFTPATFDARLVSWQDGSSTDLPQRQGKALRAQRAYSCAHRTLQSRQGAAEPALQALTVG